jgi:hypothetical protein
VVAVIMVIMVIVRGLIIGGTSTGTAFPDIVPSRARHILLPDL